ncbi:MAG: MBL fold metallo-hydrolase [Candidatus Cloacimonadia bacterium]|jgi:ribonuclease BN (tRNA processing enzyme)
MRCIILGTATGIPTLGKSHSSVYVETCDLRLLLDCGEGTSQKVLKHQLDGNHLDAIAISHNHPDHMSGIFMLLQLLYLQGREKTLYLFLPEKLEFFKQMLDTFYLFPERFKFKLVIDDIENLNQYIPEVNPIKNNHLIGYRKVIEKHSLDNKMNSYSFLVSQGNTRLMYTSDLQDVHYIEDYLDNIDALIVDALHPKHTELVNIIDRFDKKLILTHGISEGLLKYVNTLPKEKYIIAEDDYEFEL